MKLKDIKIDCVGVFKLQNGNHVVDFLIQTLVKDRQYFVGLISNDGFASWGVAPIWFEYLLLYKV